MIGQRCASRLPRANPERERESLHRAHLRVGALVDRFASGRLGERVQDRLAPALGAGGKELCDEHVGVAIHHETRQAVRFAVHQAQRIRMPGRGSADRSATARSILARRNAASIRTDASKLQTRARICDFRTPRRKRERLAVCGAHFHGIPARRVPSTFSSAPEKIHGCLRRSDFSRPRLRTIISAWREDAPRRRPWRAPESPGACIPASSKCWNGRAFPVPRADPGRLQHVRRERMAQHVRMDRRAHAAALGERLQPRVHDARRDAPAARADEERSFLPGGKPCPRPEPMAQRFARPRTDRNRAGLRAFAGDGNLAFAQIEPPSSLSSATSSASRSPDEYSSSNIAWSRSSSGARRARRRGAAAASSTESAFGSGRGLFGERKALHRIVAEPAVANEPAIQAAPRRQDLRQCASGQPLRMQQRDETAQPRGIERLEAGVLGERAEQAERMAVAGERRRPRAALVAQRIEVGLHQSLIRVRGRCALRHALGH
jgi:hypothetical protein